ncbi:hypothetical protein [Tardiphaga sp.]|uniref:hypothetical protein n=1 Tax=Tardiphaga sp. TaxID=1926292 RepID=UPI0026079886|nr:hypothetical protein [Tardiphaga sp.]MDB5620425.1 hypothetical protein [Tardiphaga sp.]
MDPNAIFDNDGNDPVLVGLLDEMTQGCLEGRNLSNPEPDGKRSWSYRHGFANGRAEKFGGPRAMAAALRVMAEQAIALDLRARKLLS